MLCKSYLLPLMMVALLLPPGERELAVRGDKEKYGDSETWIYNDLAVALERAKADNKPVLMVMRCIPCEACHDFDEQVAERDPRIADLMEKFICVRVVQANGLDLEHFQYDFDQSFAVLFLNEDLTIYGRFGTRSERKEDLDMTVEGMRLAMEKVLEMHAQYKQIKPRLDGKQVVSAPVRVPEDFPSLQQKYTSELDYEGNVVASCIHCHQVRDAERQTYRVAKQPMPDAVLFPYPDPRLIGLDLDPTQIALVTDVKPNSYAAAAGIQPGDSLVAINDQPLISIADIQWILHHAPDEAELNVQLSRGGALKDVGLELPSGWRRKGDISWRPTSWELRRMALGGMYLKPASDEQRAKAKIPKNKLALFAEHVGEYGEHAVALNAGVRKGDILTEFDGLTANLTESQLMAHGVQERLPGDEVELEVLRAGQRHRFRIKLQ